MKRFFHHELEEFRMNLNKMGQLAVENVRRAVDALLENDLAKAEEVIMKENEIDQLELKMDHEAIRYLSLRNPMAQDLRLLTSGMKTVHELERVGDEASSIASRVKKLAKKGVVEDYLEIPKMTSLALDMLRDVLDSFIENDEEKAYTLPSRDKAVDELNRNNRKAIMAQIEQIPSFSYQGIELIFISKSIERVADHAANISEEVVYLLSGEDTRHPGARASQS